MLSLYLFFEKWISLWVPAGYNIDIFILVRPLQVKILGNKAPLTAGTTIKIICEVIGSRPAPTISWSLGDILLRAQNITVSKRTDIE